MEKRFAFDIGGVIINYETNKIDDEAICSIKLVVEKYGKENVFIISKAKNKYIKLNKERLRDYNFYDKTGFFKSNLYFCDEYADKAKLCDKLKIDFMIDDSIKVIKYLNCKSFLMKKSYSLKNPQHKYYIANNINNYTYNTPTWKKFRKKINKISKYKKIL